MPMTHDLHALNAPRRTCETIAYAALPGEVIAPVGGLVWGGLVWRAHRTGFDAGEP